MNPNEQLEAVEKICKEANEATKKLPVNDADGKFGSVVQAMEFMIIRSRALHAIEKLIKDNDEFDVNS